MTTYQVAATAFYIVCAFAAILALLAAFTLITKPREIPVGPAIEDCEAKGGHLSVHYIDFQDGYYISCRVPEQEIEL